MVEQEISSEKKDTIPPSLKRRGRPSSDEPSFPRDPLSKTLKLAESIEKNNAGKPFDRLILAKSVDYTPNSGLLRQLISSSSKYGLTEGGYQAEKISLTALGSSIVAPTSDVKKQRGLLQALTNPTLFKNVYEFFDKKQIPREELLKNSLKKEFKVSPTDVDTCYDILLKNIQDYNLIEEIKGNKYLQLTNLSSLQGVSPEEVFPELSQLEESIPEQIPPPPKQEEKSKQIFVAHGKNKKSLEQLEKILGKFKVTYKVDEDEPHKGRPVSEKVADMMKDCTSGIFIFTADEKTVDKDGNEIWRPSDNVVYELGAASVLFGKKIVILKEKDVSFASDFSDLGYIPFEKDNLEAKAADLMLELINLGFMQLTPT